MELLDKELDKLKPYLTTGTDGELEVLDEDLYRAYLRDNLGQDVTRLRLDWEFSREIEDSGPDAGHVGLMIDQLRADLEDLLENGDTEQFDDALLQTLNGAKKRGKQPEDARILAALKSTEDKRETIQHTLYIILNVKW